MFNVNPFEVVVIAVLFLVLFGPERLPEIAVQAGKLYRDIRQAADAASSEFTREIESAARIGAEDEARKKAAERQARLAEQAVDASATDASATDASATDASATDDAADA